MNDFSHKLFHFEAAPPIHVWEAIASELDNTSSGFAHKLHSFETTPSARVWEHIDSELTKENPPAKIIPFHKKRSRFIRYGTMVAAIFVGVILINLFSKKANSDDAAKLKTNSISHQPNAASSGELITSADQAQVATPQKKEPRQSVTNTDTPAINKISSARYITLAKGDGKTIRLSKKIYPVIDCAAKTDALAWSRCKENIQAMQAKMATSVGAAGGDFGGLMDMIKNLEEN